MAIMNNFTSGGAPTDELTATPAEVMKGYKFLGSGSDDEQVGTLELTGNAAVNHVLQGETFYSTNPKQKLTGTMTVNSILSFSVAAYSGRRVLLKWQNPYAAAGKPYSGVIIKASTGGYPAWDAPTWDAIYAGVGDNVTPGGWSQAFMDLPALNTTYYFTCFGYAITNFGDIYSPVYDPSSIKNAVYTTVGPSLVTITGTQSFTIPYGFTTADIFCVGGGGAGGNGYRFTGDAYQQGGGGGGGGGASYGNTLWGGSGGSGVILIRLK